MDDREREARLDSLSELECQTLYWLCKGLTRKQMKDKLFISESAVYKRLGRIWEKTGVDHLSGSQRLQALVQDFCPLMLDRVEDPETDCAQKRGAAQVPDLDPDQESIEMVKEDEKRGIIPISQAIVRRKGQRDATQEPIVIPYDSRPRARAPRWLAPALLGLAFLLGAMIVLLAMNLSRRGQPEQPQVMVITATRPPATSTPAAAPAESQPTSEPVAVQPSSTPQPTNPPAATYTPHPTPTPYPTHTPYPTEAPPTSIPSPTVEEITPRDAVLEVGDWWMQDGVWLRIREVKFDNNSICLYLEFWNRTNGPLLFEWQPDYNLELSDNMGHRYEVNDDFQVRTRSEQFEAGKRDRLSPPQSHMLCPMDYKDTFFFNAGVTDLWLAVNDLSRIDHAKWHILAPK